MFKNNPRLTKIFFFFLNEGTTLPRGRVNRQIKRMREGLIQRFPRIYEILGSHFEKKIICAYCEAETYRTCLNCDFFFCMSKNLDEMPTFRTFIDKSSPIFPDEK